MAGIIMIGCGVGVLIVGVGVCIYKLKTIKRAIKKWRKGSAPREEIAMTRRFSITNKRAVIPARCMSSEATIVEKITFDRYLYITVVKPPRNFRAPEVQGELTN